MKFSVKHSVTNRNNLLAESYGYGGVVLAAGNLLNEKLIIQDYFLLIKNVLTFCRRWSN